MKNPKKLVDCSIVTLTAFLGAPILFFGFDSVTLMSLTLFVLFPLVCLICGILCGRENGLHLHYPILVALLFLPTIFLFYDSSVWPFWGLYRGCHRLLHPAWEFQYQQQRQTALNYLF